MDTNILTIDTYNHIASKYAEKYFDDTFDLPYIDGFLKQIPSRGVILDLGCGVGQFSKYMMGRGFTVVGIDASDQMLAVAKEKVPTGVFHKMDMRKLSFLPNSFDAILAAYSLIHIPESEIEGTLSACATVLKPEGSLFAITQRGVHDRWIDEPFAPGKKVFFNFFTPEAISEDLVKSGFSVVYQEEKQITDTYSGSDSIIYTTARKNSSI
jgi:2-polyprenyl-3-methyl-5-hydroxy-6-metoxy-1,4-benzoquinol methylase